MILPSYDPSLPYSVFRHAVMDRYKPGVRRPATVAKMRQVLDEFGAICDTLGDINYTAVPPWIEAHSGRCIATNLTLLSTFRAACNVARRLVPDSPFREWGPKRWFSEADLAHEPSRTFHASEDVAKVLALADRRARRGGWPARRLRALVYTLVYLGARRDEVLGLRVEDLDLAGRVVHIRPNARRRLKTRASCAVLPIPRRLRYVLAGWAAECDSEWLFPGSRRVGPWLSGANGYKPTDRIRKLGEDAGVRNFTALSARHTFATLAEGWGWGEAMIQRFLRHTTPITQRNYRHRHIPQMAAAADRIAFRRAG